MIGVTSCIVKSGDTAKQEGLVLTKNQIKFARNSRKVKVYLIFVLNC